jgi:agmatinase
MSSPDTLIPPAVGLFGWPTATGPASTPGGIEVLGVPSDVANSIASGARFGPEAIRRASLELALPGVRGLDRGDLASTHGKDWADTLLDIERVVGEIAGRRSLPVVLGGDHSISFAAVAAQRRCGPISLVWFDAHTDLCEWPGGRWHNHKQVLRRIAGLAHVGAIVQIGHRGITYSDESRRCERMTLFTAAQARALGADALLECLPADRPVYISVDIDAVDPRRAPGTGHPVPGGLEVARLAGLACVVASQRRVCGLDLMEVNPLLDRGAMTSAAAAAILSAVVSALAPQLRPHVGEPRAQRPVTSRGQDHA